MGGMGAVSEINIMMPFIPPSGILVAVENSGVVRIVTVNPSPITTPTSLPSNEAG
jgi:hypothetical protein